MTQMDVVILARVSSSDQNFERQIINLKEIASEKGWIVKRTFAEKISGLSKVNERKELNLLMKYVQEKGIKLVLVSEVSRLGRRVVDVLNLVETFHSQGIGIYIQQFNMITLENGKENPMVKLLLQMLSIGAEMEISIKKDRQREGIALAKMNGKYSGRSKGARADKVKMLSKYADVADLLKKSDLSVRRIATITNRSVNTIRKIKQLLAA
jgi:DNA invertase Pin-like site-specific DNA recombinase